MMTTVVGNTIDLLINRPVGGIADRRYLKDGLSRRSVLDAIGISQGGSLFMRTMRGMRVDITGMVDVVVRDYGRGASARSVAKRGTDATNTMIGRGITKG